MEQRRMSVGPEITTHGQHQAVQGAKRILLSHSLVGHCMPVELVANIAEEIQPFHKSFIRAATSRSLPLIDCLDGGTGVGCAPVSSSPDGLRINGVFACLDVHRENGKLTVLPDSLVERLYSAAIK